MTVELPITGPINPADAAAWANNEHEAGSELDAILIRQLKDGTAQRIQGKWQFDKASVSVAGNAFAALPPAPGKRGPKAKPAAEPPPPPPPARKPRRAPEGAVRATPPAPPPAGETAAASAATEVVAEQATVQEALA